MAGDKGCDFWLKNVFYFIFGITKFKKQNLSQPFGSCGWENFDTNHVYKSKCYRTFSMVAQ